MTDEAHGTECMVDIPVVMLGGVEQESEGSVGYTYKEEDTHKSCSIHIVES